MSIPSISTPDWTPFEHVKVAGVEIVTASRAELAAAWLADCKQEVPDRPKRARLVFDVNGHALSLRETNSAYRADLAEADVVHADGGFIVTASKRYGLPIKERSATTDMIHDFAAVAEQNSLSFYLLGGTEEINRDATERLKEIYPNLRIAGRRNGYFTEDEEASILEEINQAAPHILWVGLGKPKEQAFSVRNREKLHARWIVTCGGCFNYITGTYTRAPAWMQKNNLEWLHRMITNPRLIWRYLTTTPHALFITIFRT